MDFDSMSEFHKGVYAGIFEAWAFENAMHKDGVSKHRVPTTLYSPYPDYEMPFDMERFLAAESELDDEGGIYAVGFEIVDSEPFIFLYCTEAEQTTWYDYDAGKWPTNTDDVLGRYNEWALEKRIV